MPYYCVLLSQEMLLLFHRNVLPPSAESKDEAVKWMNKKTEPSGSNRVEVEVEGHDWHSLEHFQAFSSHTRYSGFRSFVIRLVLPSTRT